MSDDKERKSTESLDSLSDSIDESQGEFLSGDIVSDLLGTGLKKADPTQRDFGDRYEFRSVLGEGGQGLVMSARDMTLDRDVALKTLKGHADKIREEYLTREAKISAILEHPNIPPTYDLGEDETGTPYFVMRKVQGISLDEVLRDIRKSKAEANGDKDKDNGDQYSRIRLLSIFIQVCNAIEYAHSRGILHLDIKPQNIKLGAFGEVFVLDWGFAARKDEAQKIFGGTPIYIAPERLNKLSPDERSDVYSLGVLLYRLLTGERPYDVSDMTFKEYCKEFYSLQLVPPRERDPSIPKDLEAIILKAMARHRDDRYPHVRNLARDLQRFLDGVPVSAYESGPLHKLVKAARRHSAFTIILLASTVAFIASLTAINYHNKQQQLKKIAEAANKKRAADELELLKEKQIRQDASIPFQKGRAVLEKNPPQLDTARRYFSQAINSDPTFAEAYFERGKVYMRLGNMAEALADFRQTLSINPQFIMAHYYAGSIYFTDVSDLQNYDLARKEFEAMQTIDEDNEYSNLGLARLYFMDKRYDEAMEMCDRIEKRNPDFRDKAVYYLRGYIYGYDPRKPAQNKYYDPKKAIESYDKFIEHEQGNVTADLVTAYLNRGDLRLHEGDVDGALTDYDAALAINPDYVSVLNNRGWIYYSNLKQPERALKDFNRAAAARPEAYWTYMNRGSVYEFLKEWDKAEQDYNWAWDLVRDSAASDRPVGVLQRMGLCYFRQGKMEEALSAFSRGMSRTPWSSKPSALHLRLGQTYFALGQYNQALAELDNAISTSDSPGFFANMLRHHTLMRLKKSPDPTPLQKLADEKTDHPWYGEIIKCWRGIVTPEYVFINIDTPQARCETSYYLGMFCLLYENNVERATRYFTACRLTADTAPEVHLYSIYALAGVELKRIEKQRVP